MRNAALVIFDCDGVLVVDSERLSHAVLRDMLAEMGVRLSIEQTVNRFIGTSMPVCAERITQLRGRPPPDGSRKEFASRTRAAFTEHLTIVPGVDGLLSSLAMPYCVASNGNHAKVNFTLQHTGVFPLFAQRIFTAQDVEQPKPAPDLFLHAARCLDTAPSRVVVVEDTPTGIIAARSAGMHAIGFAAMTPAALLRDAGAQAVVATMDELRAMLVA